MQVEFSIGRCLSLSFLLCASVVVFLCKVDHRDTEKTEKFLTLIDSHCLDDVFVVFGVDVGKEL